jgi:hypothetical protein
VSTSSRRGCSFFFLPGSRVTTDQRVLHNEQNIRQDNAHRQRTGNPVFLMIMCSDGKYNHANPFRNGRGRSQSVSWTMQPVPLSHVSYTNLKYFARCTSIRLASTTAPNLNNLGQEGHLESLDQEKNVRFQKQVLTAESRNMLKCERNGHY